MDLREKDEQVRDVQLMRQRVKSLGLKLWWVAEQTGVHKTTLRRWFNGRIAEPSPTAWDRLERLVKREEQT